MASSGVVPESNVAEIFNEIKLRHKYRYLIFALSEDNKTIQVVSKGDKDSTYEQFIEEMKEKPGCYAVYDKEFEKEDKHLGNETCTSKKDAIVFFVWIPETCQIKRKMILASSKDALKKVLTGIKVEIQATDLSEMNEDTVDQCCRDKTR